MLDGYKNVREWRIWTRGGARQEKQCRFWGGMLRMWNVECGMWEWGMRHGNVLPQISTETMRVALSKNTDFTDAHGWVFSRILYSCSAAYRLVLMRRRRNGLPRIFRRQRVVWENVTRWACLVCEKSVEIREICGRQLSAQCAKEQAECIYSPTDLSDKHRCHADCLSITQIAPSARQIDTDFSQAESTMK